MPSVPRINEMVDSRALPNQQLDSAPAVRSLATNGLSNEAQNAMVGVVNTIEKVSEQDQDRRRKAQDKALTTWSQGIDDKALTWKQNKLYDPREGVYKIGKGENALPVGQAARVEYKKYLDELAGTAADNDQRELAKRIVSKRYQDFDSDLLHHEKSEDSVLSKGKHEGAINAYRNEAILNYRNPKRVSETIALQDAAIHTYLDDNGIKGEQANQAVAKERSKTLTNIVKRYVVNEQDQEAKAFYNANKDGFTADDIDDVEKSINAGTHQGEVFRFKDSITKQYPYTESSLGFWRKAAQDIKDPKVRKDVDSELVREDEIQRKTLKINGDNIYVDAMAEMDANGGDYTKLNPILKQNLTRDQIRGLETRAYGKKEAQRRAEDRDERKREHAEDRAYHLSDRLERKGERLADREERQADRDESKSQRIEREAYNKSIRDDKEKRRKDKEAGKTEDGGDFEQDDKVFHHHMYGMPAKDLAKMTEADLNTAVDPYVTDDNYEKVLRRWSAAREEAGKPPKAVRLAKEKAILDRHKRSGSSKIEQFKPIDDGKFLLKNLQALPSSGIKDGDTNAEVAQSKDKSKTFRIFSENVNDEAKAFFNANGRNPNYEEREQIVKKLVTKSVFTKEKALGMDWLAKDKETPVGLISRDNQNVYVPFSKILPTERQPFVNVAGRIPGFNDLPKAKKENRIERAFAAKKRGASVSEQLEILKKDE